MALVHVVEVDIFKALGGWYVRWREFKVFRAVDNCVFEIDCMLLFEMKVAWRLEFTEDGWLRIAVTVIPIIEDRVSEGIGQIWPLSFYQSDQDLLLVGQKRREIQVVVLVRYTAIGLAVTLPLSPSDAIDKGVVIQGLLDN